MITVSNKNLSPTVIKAETSIPVYDETGKNLRKVNNSYYGKLEANPYTPNPLLSNYIFNRGKFNYTIVNKSFEYDFAETNRIIDTESIVAAVFRKKKMGILKNEPILKSNNQKNLDYIKKRLSEMEYVSGISFSDFLDAIAECLVNYNNVFLLKHKNEISSSGLTHEGVRPLASLFVLSPTRLSPLTNELGEVIAYSYKSLNKQQPAKIFDKKDVYHLYTDKKIDLTVGTPPLEAVKDDILSLRQIEESLERLVYKNSSPLLHVKVGTDKQPAGRLADGTPEVEYYNDLVQNMDDDGGLTTSHRVDIKMLGAESQALRLDLPLAYFKARVLSGLKASLLDIGEADSISTAGAEAVSKVLKEDIQSYQKILEKFFTKKVFNDILLEAKWYKDSVTIPSEEEVQFKLLESDLNDTIKVESHLANLVRYGLMSPEVFAKETGRPAPPITFTPEGISGNISNSGAFSAISSPQNQHTDAIDVEYQVLDNIIKSDNDVLLPKLYYYVEDTLKDVVSDEAVLEGISLDLYNIANKLKSSKIESKLISKTLFSTLEKIVIKELVKES